MRRSYAFTRCIFRIVHSCVWNQITNITQSYVWKSFVHSCVWNEMICIKSMYSLNYMYENHSRHHMHPQDRNVLWIVHLYVWSQMHSHIHICIYIYTHMYINKYTYICIYLYLYIYIYIYICMYMNTYIYIWIYTHIHVYHMSTYVSICA